MATVVKASNAHTAVSTGWTNPSNAFSTTTDSSFATGTPGKNGTISGDFGFANFTTSDIPDGSTINSVTLNFNIGMSAAVTGGTVGGQIRNNGTALGSETTSTSTTQTTRTQQVTSGVSLSDLRSASTLIKGRIRVSQGNTASAMTGNLDFASLTVDFTPPPSRNTIVSATRRAQQTARKILRHPGAVMIAALTPAFVVHGTVNRPIPFGVSAAASVQVDAVVSKAIPIGRTITGTAGSGTTTLPRPAITKVPRAKRGTRRRGGITIAGLTPGFVVHGTVNTAIPLGRTITGTVTGGGGSPVSPRQTIKVVKKRRPRGHLGGVTVLGFVIPAPVVHGTVTLPIPLGRAIQASADAFLAPSTGITTVERRDPKPRRGRVILRKAVPQVGRVGIVNQPVPLTRTISGSVQVDASLNRPIPLGRSIGGTVSNGATLTRPIPIGRTVVGSVQVDGTLSQPIPIGRAIAGALGTAVSGTVNVPIVLGRTIAGSVTVDGAVSQPIPIGRQLQASVSGNAVLNQPIPLARSARGTTSSVTTTAAPTTVDVRSTVRASLVIAAQATGVDLTQSIASVDLTRVRASLTITSTDSEAMPNLLHVMKQGDTSPALVAVLGTLNTDGTITPDNLTGCTVVINMRLGKTLIVSGGTCSILDAVNGQVRYDWGTNDTARSGDGDAEFKSTDGGGKVKRYPEEGNFTVKIYPQVGP